MRVLIADDDKLVCSMLTAFVEECGHEVVEAVSGGGLAVIKSFAQHLPDVVLLDVFMPRCNGLTVCHALLSRKPDTKVVFMSGMVEGSHPYVAGARASAFLAKPMRLEELRATFERLGASEKPAITLLPPVEAAVAA
jgi:CheY-like chemotaxis protein